MHLSPTPSGTGPQLRTTAMTRNRLLPLLLAALVPLGLLAAGAAAQDSRSGATVVIVPRKADPNQRVSFNFNQADIDDVLRFLADASGKIVFKDPTVSLSVTIRAADPVSVAEAIRLVQSVLALKGFSMIETPDALIVTTSTEARTRRSVSVTAGRDLSLLPQGSEIITHIIPLISADANRLRQELQQIFPANSVGITANGDTNSLVIVDEADTVRRILRIILELDRDLTDETNVEVIPLKYADAAAVARYMTELFRPEDQNRTGGPQPGQQPGQPPGRPGTPPGAAAPATPGALSTLRGRVRFAADERSNALIVYASPANIRAVREIVERIDVNVAPRTEYRIVALKYADATSLADQLNQLVDPNATGGRGFFPFFGGGGGRGGDSERGLQEYKVVPDVRTNSLILTAPIDAIEALEALVRQLDKPALVQEVVRAFQLQNAIASEVAGTLQQLFQGQTGGGGFGFALFGGGGRGQIPPGSPLDLLRQVTIVPNDQTNTLFISGPAQTFEVINDLLRPEGPLDRRLPQVFIEVIIADITLDDETKFGIEWNAVSGSNALGTNFGLASPTADSTGFRYSVLSDNFKATLQALGRTDRIKIISTPHVLVTDNSPALISIGESIPYAGSTTFTQGVAQTSVDFQDVAITLNVTPHISFADQILMDIDQVVNSLIEFIQVAPGQVAPRTTSRRAGTTVIVDNDQTVVLGGIISDDQKRNITKIPILGDIPIIGNLFRSTSKSSRRTELVVFLTPHVVRDFEENDYIRQYERNRLQVDPLDVLEAPFHRPLKISPEDLRLRRDRPREKAVPGEPDPGPDTLRDDKKRGLASPAQPASTRTALQRPLSPSLFTNSKGGLFGDGARFRSVEPAAAGPPSAPKAPPGPTPPGSAQPQAPAAPPPPAAGAGEPEAAAD